MRGSHMGLNEGSNYVNKETCRDSDLTRTVNEKKRKVSYVVNE